MAKRSKEHKLKQSENQKAKIVWDEVYRLVEAGATAVSIAGYFGIDVKTLYNRCSADLGITYSTLKRQKRGKGDALLYLAGYEAALNGQHDPKFAPNLIFMLKARLKMSEKAKEETLTNAKIEVVSPNASNTTTD